MADKDDGSLELQLLHLSMLTQYGKDYLNVAANAANYLKLDFSGDSPLSQDKKEEIYSILINTIDRHIALLKQVVEEERKYLDTRQLGDESH
jgi:hypothetical protein